jgi:hypothetical protein
VVAVLGKVGQMAEVGERANHADRLVTRQALEQLLEGLVCFVIRIAAKCDRQLADLFNQVEGGDAFLLTNHITQNAPEKTNVFDQGAFVVFGAFGGLGFWWGDHDVFSGVGLRTAAVAMLAFSDPSDY